MRKCHLRWLPSPAAGRRSPVAEHDIAQDEHRPRSPITSTAALIALSERGWSDLRASPYRHMRFATTCYGPHDRSELAITEEVRGAGHHLPHVDIC